jgi:ABC-type uncharacterized transport system ATPase subunit
MTSWIGVVRVDTSKTFLLEGKRLVKRFGDFTALDRVDVNLNKGEVHAILGENGAGKSTLMKILYGVYVAEEGQLYMDGKQVVLNPPSRARAMGIGMVFQDFRLVPALTVLENISLSLSNTGLWLNTKQLAANIRRVSESYNLNVNPDAYVWELDLGQQQRVEIVKALLQGDTKILIFDEPTSVLTPHEVDAFLEMLKRLRADGFGILLITHKIREVVAVADRVTVLRLGKVVAQMDKANLPGNVLDDREMVAAMIGSQHIPQPPEKNAPIIERNEPALRVEHLTVNNDHNQQVLRNISFSIQAGQLMGLAGISGNGQRELLETIYGLRKQASGKIFINGKDISNVAVDRRIDSGMIYVTEDPVNESVVPGMSILEHMALTGLQMIEKGLDIDWKKMQSQFEKLPEVQILRVADSNRKVETLSGGNIQRMILARAICKSPEVLMIAYPSRGLDIATTRATQKLLVSLCEQGAAILLLSEDLTELFEISDEMIVLSNHRIYGPYNPKKIDLYRMGHIMLEGDESA